MPGIAGLISRLPADRCGRLVQRMLESMQHEKFYVSGTCAAPELGVFAGWVSLEDSPARFQPVVTDQSGVSGVFGGEVFPDRDVSQGGDSAWLIRLYENKGDDFFNSLNGLFSGLLIDRRTRQVFLFNDRYGMGRIYYHEGKDGFYFATEAKALLRILPELRAFDEDGLVQFLRYGCTLDGKTLFRDITLLPAASVWIFTGQKCDKRRYFSPAAWELQDSVPAERFEDELQDTLTRVLPRYFASDEPIGVSLTGGLDTRMIMACRPKTPQGLISYTWAGQTGHTLDAQLAAQVAKACEVSHQLIRISDDFFSDFASLVDRTVYVTDGYLGVSGAHEIYLNRVARDLSPVRLTGNFGSEILRGVTTFKPLGVSAGLMHPDLRRAATDESLRLTKSAIHPVSFAAFREIPWHLFGVAKAAQSQLTTRTPYLDNDVVALAFRTPEQLRRSAAAALHVIRDNDSGLARIRTDSGLLPASGFSSFWGSLWHRPTFKLDYWRNEGLPNSLSALDTLLSRVPVGRSLLPEHRYLHYRKWFRMQLAAYLRERLSDPETLRSHLWNRSFLERIAEAHISGRTNYLREIDTVLTCAAIDRLLLVSG